MPESWIEDIRRRLSATRTWPDRPILREAGTGAPLRPAAILIPLFVKNRELCTLLTKRTESVEHHKGQISFPGGGREPADPNLWTTAVREAEEEIGLPAAAVRLLGVLPKLVTVTDFEISPFVGAIPYPIALTPQAREVAEILEIPVPYLLRPDIAEEKEIVWKGREVRTRVYHYKGHAIWGATAHILTDFLGVLRGEAPMNPDKAADEQGDPDRKAGPA